MLTGIDLNSVRFADPLYLWLLILPAVLLIVWGWQLSRRRRDTRRFRQHRRLPVRERFPIFGGLAFWLERVTDAMPSTLLGLGIACVFPIVGSRLRRTPVAVAGVIACAALLIFGCVRPVPGSIAAENFAGVGFFLFALAPWESKGVARMAGWGALAYGFYLLHVLMIEGAQAAMIVTHVPKSAVADVMVYVVAVAGTFLGVFWLSRWKMTRVLIP